MARAQSNPHQDEIDAVGSFFEVEQELAALQASAPEVPTNEHISCCPAIAMLR